MELWDTANLDVEPHAPQILRSDDGAARVIAIDLPAGEELQEHEVHEHAYVFVASGEIEIREGGVARKAGAGALAHFEPHERHEVAAVQDSRILLILAPWPGEGHPSLR